MARFRGGGQEKSIAKQLMKDINRELARGIQSTAISVMNGLVDAGPAWSGEFSASWRFVPEGQSGGSPGQPGEIYTYSKKDIRVTTIERYIKAGVKRFQWVNTSEHANIAIDGIAGKFEQKGASLKPNKFTGWRPTNEQGDQVEGIRGDLESATFHDGTPGTATAPLDWYITYTKGGGLDFDLKRGFSAGFGGSF